MCRNAMRLIWKYCKCFVLLISPCFFICCKDYGAVQYDADYILQKYRAGIDKQINPLWENEVSSAHSANVKRMIDLVDAEITGTNRLLESCNANM